MRYILILALALSFTACSETANNENHTHEHAADSTQNDTSDLEVLIPVGGAVEQTTRGMR